MPTADDCTCANLCPDSADCICIFIEAKGEEEAECWVLCSEVRSSDGRRPAKTVALDSRVNLDMRDASFGKAGKLLAAIADADICVPADRMDERRTLYLQGVSLETVIRELGLMAVVRP